MDIWLLLLFPGPGHTHDLWEVDPILNLLDREVILGQDQDLERIQGTVEVDPDHTIDLYLDLDLLLDLDLGLNIDLKLRVEPNLVPDQNLNQSLDLVLNTYLNLGPTADQPPVLDQDLAVIQKIVPIRNHDRDPEEKIILVQDQDLPQDLDRFQYLDDVGLLHSLIKGE